MTADGYRSAAEAETAFYAAFENADLAAMMRVWARADDIECIHPLGERLVGVTAIGNSWQRIFSGRKRLRFQLSDINRYADKRLVMHVLYEKISIGSNRQPPVIATNVYRFNGNGWHMVLHHASIATDISTEDDNPEPDPDIQILH